MSHFISPFLLFLPFSSLWSKWARVISSLASSPLRPLLHSLVRPPFRPPQPTKETAGSWGSILDRCLQKKSIFHLSLSCLSHLYFTSLQDRLPERIHTLLYFLSLPFPFCYFFPLCINYLTPILHITFLFFFTSTSPTFLEPFLLSVYLSFRLSVCLYNRSLLYFLRVVYDIYDMIYTK